MDSLIGDSDLDCFIKMEGIDVCCFRSFTKLVLYSILVAGKLRGVLLYELLFRLFVGFEIDNRNSIRPFFDDTIGDE